MVTLLRKLIAGVLLTAGAVVGAPDAHALLTSNGLYVNGLYVNGLYVNGLYVNGLYVNGTDAGQAFVVESVELGGGSVTAPVSAQ